MHIIIPMSGVGKRFIDAGYSTPKPLIEIDGKAIIQHVVELFPGESKFSFICNEYHLQTTNMTEILKRIAPEGEIITIPAHKKGPVYAICQMLERINDEEEVIVNYCDFGTWWDYKSFLNHTRSRHADGAVVSYKDFHPHMLGSTNYAFMRDEKQWLLEIKEKEPFTDNRMAEYASNGTYYFKHGRYVKKYFPLLIEQNINLNGEFYVSLIYNLLRDDQLSVSIYNIQHMLQWGTPHDVEEYLTWSDYFRQLVKPAPVWNPQPGSETLIPLAGHGSRFADQGYLDPKPLLDVGGKPMIIQATDQLPASEHYNFVCLQDHVERYQLDQVLQHWHPGCRVTAIDGVTEGQAITCGLGLTQVSEEAPLLIAACDNGMLWNQEKYAALLADDSIDAIIWTFKGHPSAKQNPQMYGWVICDGENQDRATGVSVKKPISETPENDHAIVGTFYFRRSGYFSQALSKLQQDNTRVNGEFYVDSMMGSLIELGYCVAVFEVDAYIGWGTPDDYETYLYWQSFFHKNPDHPYRIDKDRTVNHQQDQTLISKCLDFKQDHN